MIVSPDIIITGHIARLDGYVLHDQVIKKSKRFISILRWKSTSWFITHMSENTTMRHQCSSLVINAQMYTLMSKKGHRWTKIYNSWHTWTSWKEERGWGCPEFGTFPGIRWVFKIQISSVGLEKRSDFLWVKQCYFHPNFHGGMFIPFLQVTPLKPPKTASKWYDFLIVAWYDTQVFPTVFYIMLRVRSIA